MWCKSCRQDVPGIASSLDRQYCCARCGSVLELPSAVNASLAGDADATATGSVAAASSPGEAAPPEFDFWETNEQLRHVERVLQAVQRSIESHDDLTGATDDPEQRQRLWRYDPADATKLHSSAKPTPAASSDERPTRSESRRHGGRTMRIDSAAARRVPAPVPSSSGYTLLTGALAWLAWAGGITAFTCGTVLCGWSWHEGRDDLWNLGLPILLVGQLGLIAGLVLRLDMLRQRNRRTESQIEAVDERLKSLSKRMKRK